MAILIISAAVPWIGALIAFRSAKRQSCEVPDHGVVCCFRKALNHAGAWEVLLEQINHQLTNCGVLVKKGAIVDASVKPTPCKPKGKNNHALEDKQEPPLDKTLQPSVGQEAHGLSSAINCSMTTSATT